MLLISQGIDSPVAGWLMKKKLDIIGLHFDNEVGSASKVKRLCKIIGVKKLYVVKHSSFITNIIEKINRRFTCVICKRMMYRITNKIAERENCSFLITGESLGQVASQTLDNLVVLDDASKLVVLRPLLSYDKEETIQIAKRIGTYSISTEANWRCKYLPKKPVTKAKLTAIKKQEERLDVNWLVEESVKGAVVVRIQ
ncbi:hypothetical protein DRJ17_03040 [Candidatus Woesearchaeota archaeon]|nr:MAG: hypothetical protein DRJ17_03040 [Candidatus Woesearchaeota archaeon]